MGYYCAYCSDISMCWLGPTPTTPVSVHGVLSAIEHVKEGEANKDGQGEKRDEQQAAEQPSLVFHVHEDSDDQSRLDTGNGQRPDDLVLSQFDPGDQHRQSGQEQEKKPDDRQFRVAYDVMGINSRHGNSSGSFLPFVLLGVFFDHLFIEFNRFSARWHFFAIFQTHENGSIDNCRLVSWVNCQCLV